MRFYPIPLIAAWLLMAIPSRAQDDSRYALLLKSGSFTPSKNITEAGIGLFNSRAAPSAGKSFAILQFEQLPTLSEKQQLLQEGIELLDYVPNNAYTVTISGSLNEISLQRLHARAILTPAPRQKMQPELARGEFPPHAVKQAGTLDLWISYPRSFSLEQVKLELQRNNFDILNTDYRLYHVLALRIAASRLEELAAQPFIEYVQAVPHPDQALNYNSMYASRANLLKAPLAAGGKNLDGQGVVVGIGDNGDVQSHLDFNGRLINRAAEVMRAHATHVAGTVGGAGIIQELYAGYAPKATLLAQYFTGIFSNAPAYIQDYGMVITNNSFGSVTDDCNYNGLYDLSSRILDQQAIDLPELQQVFAAGNDGANTCSPYATGFKTVLGGYQSAKNVITVGATYYNSNVANFSSRGPVRDGRVKPEILSQGDFVASTWTSNLYSYNTGTSMAAPGVSGALALLVQRYRQLHAGANPKNGLTKALLCNGGDDKGNAGPDYKYGYGRMNLLRTLAMMENTSYFTTTVANTVTNTHTIAVPANTAQLKVLLYWQDPPAAVMASQTLVNDLDLEVVDPSSSTILPAVLDTLTANVDNPATSGADHINNIEQVVISNPAAGNYDLKIKGTAITQNPSQEYFLVYDVIPQSLVLTNPVGSERLVPSVSAYDTCYVQWDDYSSAGTYTLEFSSNNGGSWTTLSSTVPASSRIYSWGVPNTPTDQAKIRITNNNNALTQTSAAFTITAMSTVTLDAVQCEGYIKINWTAVPGATDYEVMWLQGTEMVSMATTAGLTYTFSGLSKDSLYWVTVRPRINGNPGRRAAAISRQPNSGTCAGTISDNDLKADAILSPSASGREFTSTALSGTHAITIRIKNLDDAVSSGNINVSYSINGGAPVNEVITSPAADIAAGGTISHTFASTANLSATGTYSILVTATKGTDPVTANNSLTNVFKQLANASITNAQLPWLDDFESASVQTVNADQLGLSGRDRYDFVNSTQYGQARTFINTGIAYSGNLALTLDQDRFVSGGNVDSLTGTFNLATFNPATDDIRIDFRYKNHGQESNTADKVWIRGSEADPWIEVYNLYTNQNAADGSYKLSGSIELSDSLAAHSQVFSTSTQVRWGQWGEYLAADDLKAAGYTFDDIRLYKAVDDIQLVRIDTPYTVSCGLNTTVPVKATIRNSSNSAINNIPVTLKVDGVVIANETIASIAASSAIQYTFTATANLSATGNHTIEVWTALATDTYKENDTASSTVNNLPLISSFPYLQNFESGNGSWYTGGTSSTWEYGTPVSPKINRAASGSKAWKTKIAGYYNDAEYSYLYSPCFDLSGLTNPTLSLSLSLNLEDCGAVLCDAAWVEYSADGITWTKLGSMGQGTNWYNKNYAGNQLWSQQDYTRWHVASTALPATNNSKLRLRFVFNSDAALDKDGIAVDDIHIYDNLYGLYDGATMAAPVTQTISSGTNTWVNFLECGKLVASVHPGGQEMGATDVRTYLYTGAVRWSNNQYYHNRNFTIQPANAFLSLTDSVLVRLYFPDTETETLINATNCSPCSKPSTAYDLGVSKYSDPDNNFENGTIADNNQGVWTYIIPANATKVPFDKGYYAEFKVNNFSEFWLNNGGLTGSQPLPVQLLSFTARKQALQEVVTEWVTASETNVNRFEIELARGNADYQLGRYSKIGEEVSQGNADREQYYRFVDREPNKSGVRYYRLKIVDNDGSSHYSVIRPVVFNEDTRWAVTPNPSSGHFNLVCQAGTGETISVKVYDNQGRVVFRKDNPASGFVQKLSIDLKGPAYPAGIYLLETGVGDKRNVFKLVKQ
ncbi:MAG: S8 family serine peptidase [Sphingobacteriales bacterium]|nr:S8 family serine peptidase [Sphingobacteriales bacterium]